MENMLKELFCIQNHQNKEWWNPDKFQYDEEYKNHVTMNYVAGIIEQATKALNATDWKKHRLLKNKDEEELIEQCIDVIKYAIGLLLFNGVDYDEFYKKYIQKSEKLYLEWEYQKKKLTKDTKVVVWDIDGVICNFASDYTKYVCKKLNLDYDEVTKRMQNRGNYYLHQAFGITKLEEEKLQCDFYTEGNMEKHTAFHTAVGVLLKTQSVGVKTVLITARPYWTFKRIYMDTINWLHAHNIYPDLLLFNKDKAQAIIDNVFPAKVLCVVEDRDKHVFEIKQISIPVVLVSKSYNRHVEEDGKTIIRVTDENWLKYEQLLKKQGVELC